MKKSIIRIIVLTAVAAIMLAGCIDPLNPLGGGDNKKLEGSVSITGTAQVGQTLSANTGNLGGSGVITFQWQRGGVVVGHNNSMYVVQAGDVGHTITVTVTRSENTGSVTSGATARVIDLPMLTINYDSRGGTVSPVASESRVFPGTPVNIRATPASGYRFDGWSVTSGTAEFGNSDSASTTVTLSADAAIRANFQQLVTLTVDRDPTDGGTVSPTSQSGIVPGTWIDIRATPASGYGFVNWTVSGSGTAEFGNADNASTTVRLSSNATIRANFRQTFTLTVNASHADGGTVSPTTSQSPRIVPAGTPIDITAAPANGYRFVNWIVVSGTATFGNASDTSTTVRLSSNAIIRANFQINALTVNANPVAGGTVSPTSQTGVVFGIPINITATPASGYRFVNWTVVSGTAEFGNADNASTTVTLSANAVIRANFEQTYTLTVNASPAAGGTVSPTSQTDIVSGTPVNITATPASNFRFVRWTVVNGTATFGNANDASTTVTLSTNATIRANFQQYLFTLTANANPTVGGTVSPASQTGVASGTSINITATPESGYTFVNWTLSGGSSSSAFGNANNASTTVTLSSDMTIRANFQINTLTVNASPAVGGTVSPTSQSGVVFGTPINITATPESGFIFVNWTVTGGTAEFGNADNASTTVTLSTDATIRANFQTFTLTVNANPTAGGTISPASQVNVTPGVPFNIAAEPTSGYRFINWTVVSGTAVFGNANDAATTVTLSANTTIRANFQTFTLTINANPTAGGTISPASQVNVTPGVPFNIAAEPTNGYRFVNWTVISGTAVFGNANDAATTVTLSANATIMVNFQGEVIDGGILTYGSQDYRTVIIGGRRWMAENLNFAGSGGNLGVCYGNDASNCNIYGRLYTWAEAMNLPSSCNFALCANQVQNNHQGACPVGWRVPSNADWTTLATTFVGSNSCTKLKSQTGWNTGNGTDEFGFSALPGGRRFPDGFFERGGWGAWWSVTEPNANGNVDGALYCSMSYDCTDVSLGGLNSKSNSSSLRCIMND